MYNVPGFLSEVLWEGECCYQDATISEFLHWNRNTDGTTGDADQRALLSQYSKDHWWCYADYKYMTELFDTENILKVSSLYCY